MRLTVVSPFLDRLHGTELCIIEQIEHLASRHSWEIHLYSQSVKDVHGLQPVTDLVEDLPGSIYWHKVSALPGPHLLNYLWWFFANHWQRWRDRRSGSVCSDLVYSPGINCFDADVIVVHIVFHAFYERVRSELALYRVPVRSWPLLIHRKLYYKLIMFLERRIYRDPDVRLVAVSSLVAAQLKSNFRREDVTVIPNAVDTFRFTPEARMVRRNASRQSLSYAASDFVLLLIGNDWKKKGLDTLLKALTLLTDLPLRALVVGSDEPSFYRPLLGQLALQDRVRFEKPSADVLSFYAAADLYVGPSLEDAFNLPILEAMTCGLPIIASAHAGVSEIVRDGEIGFVLRDPQDHLQLAHLIRRLYADETLRQTMGDAASRHVLRNCGWDENTKKTREFLENALQQLSRN
jgi:UDP-glucose:(heptosyl)LPS alpha-1,3-glucosyltransferase